MKISEILAKYDTDKIVSHRYGEPYDKMFAKFDRNAPLNILEVGTQKGGSLLAWKEYFPNANVYGVDIVDAVLDEYKKDTVTRIISDIKRWDNDIEWDIVIDDGSHYLLDIAYVVANYAVKLKLGGMIIVEDVRDPTLIWNTIVNLLNDISLPFPNFDTKSTIFEMDFFNTSGKGYEGSVIISMTKVKL